MYEPTRPNLIILRSRLTDAAWQKRVDDANAVRSVADAVLREVQGGTSLNRSIAAHLPASRRSWATRRIPRYREFGFEGLIDERLPREPSQVKGVWIRELITEAVAGRSDLDLAGVLPLLVARGIKPLPSPATIEAELARAGVIVRRAVKLQRLDEEIVDLPLAGGELLLAAELETGAIAALTQEVVALGEEAKAASVGLEPARDTEHRSAEGTFTATYNRGRRRKKGEDTASHLRTAAEKAEGRVPSWPRFVHERPDTIDAKIRMLVFEPMVSRMKGWNGLRTPEAAGLLPLAGYAYMPSTLAKFTSALAISNAGPRLLESAGRCWHEVAARRGEEGAMAALYVDNHVKEIWTDLFTKAAKVSRLSRVMPAITTTWVHTGAGTPLVLGIQSGAAPLAPKLPALVNRAEEILGDSIRRAVIVDSEGSTFDLLEAFARERRVIVTPLRPSRAPELELEYGAGSYFRPFRENDELRVATAVLHHRSTNRSLEVGALIVRRKHRESDTILLTTGTALGMEGRDLAELYFERWPLQENWFKDAGAVKLGEHRGNCSRMVANVAIVTAMERWTSKLALLDSRRDMLEAQHAEATSASSCANDERVASERRLASRRGKLDALVAAAKTHTKAFASTAAEHHLALVELEASGKAFASAHRGFDRSRAALEKHDAQRATLRAKLKTAAPMSRIREVDVALDSILTATKLTGLQLTSFANREYLPELGLSPQTFIARVFPLRGRRERRSGEEHIVFYENPRDPEVSQGLVSACARLNRRGLVRDGRSLRYSVEQEPTGVSVVIK